MKRGLILAGLLLNVANECRVRKAVISQLQACCVGKSEIADSCLHRRNLPPNVAYIVAGVIRGVCQFGVFKWRFHFSRPPLNDFISPFGLKAARRRTRLRDAGVIQVGGIQAVLSINGARA